MKKYLNFWWWPGALFATFCFALAVNVIQWRSKSNEINEVTAKGVQVFLHKLVLPVSVVFWVFTISFLGLYFFSEKIFALFAY